MGFENTWYYLVYNIQQKPQIWTITTEIIFMINSTFNFIIISLECNQLKQKSWKYQVLILKPMMKPKKLHGKEKTKDNEIRYNKIKTVC